MTSNSYGYDGLDRLASSKSTSGEKNTYSYDPAGNRTGWARSGAADGNFSQSASFNDANRLMQSVTSGSGRGVSGGVASYSYDGAGNRVSQSVAGVGTSFAYNASGQATQVARDGRSTSYAYDGLGRQASSADETKYGTETTSNVYDGTSLMQSTSSTQGTTTLVRDAAGSLAEHVSTSGEATWDLLDGLGSTIAGVSGGSVTELASYDDWGAQQLETEGWSAPEGYTGHAQDVTQGLIHTFARSYDVATGTWTAPDTWRGLLTQPKSLARYQYAFNNPTTNWDPDGHMCVRKAPNLPPILYGNCGPFANTPISDPKNGGGYIHALPQNPTYGTQGGKTPDAPAKPKANGPNSQNDVSARHERDMWITVSDVLGVLGGVFGFLSLIPGPQQPIFAALSVISSLGGTIISCILGGDQLASCIIGIILSAIPAVGASAKAAFRGVLVDAVNGAVNAVGRMGDGLGIVTGGGDLVTRNR